MTIDIVEYIFYSFLVITLWEIRNKLAGIEQELNLLRKDYKDNNER